MGGNPAADYTTGEMKALIAPLLGIDPDDLSTVYIVALSRQHHLAVQSNISSVYQRLRLLMATMEYELRVHTGPIDPDICECPAAPGPHPRTEDCPPGEDEAGV